MNGRKARDLSLAGIAVSVSAMSLLAVAGTNASEGQFCTFSACYTNPSDDPYGYWSHYGVCDYGSEGGCSCWASGFDITVGHYLIQTHYSEYCFTE